MKSTIVGIPKTIIVPLSEMKPLQIGRIVSGPADTGNYVMRTCDDAKFEVMDITKCSKNACWDTPVSSIRVELLPPGSKVIFEVE
jgi:hypothetical protein